MPKSRIGAILGLVLKGKRAASRIMLVSICVMLMFLAACSTGGSEDRASRDPADDFGTPDVYDDFSGTNPEFELDNPGGVARGWYENGQFNIVYPARGWWTWYSGGSAAADFYVDVVVYNGDQCADRDAAGLLYRYVQSYDAGLLFGVTCEGGYFSGIHGALGAMDGICWFTNSTPDGPEDLDCSTLWDLPTSNRINDGPGASNRLGVRAVGPQITLYINGHEVDSFTISPVVSQYGEFALYLGSTQEDNASASFDDFSMWRNP